MGNLFSSKPETLFCPPSSKTMRTTTSTPVQTRSITSSYQYPNLPSYTIPKTTAHQTNYPKLPSSTTSAPTVQQLPFSSSYTPTYSSQAHQPAWERPAQLAQRYETPRRALRSTKDVYESKEEYRSIMRELVEAEEENERKVTEAWIVKGAYIQWTQKDRRSLIGKLHLSEEHKKAGDISVETKLKIAYGTTWETEVFIDEIVDEELTITSRDHSENPPVFSGNFTVTQIFNNIVYTRMKDGLDRFLNPNSMSNEVSSMILGKLSSIHYQTSIVDASRFYKYDLNSSQRKAAQEALGGSPIYLILGPPGTGKTKTSVAIIAELSHYIQTRKSGEKILVCGPSNTAVDDLALKLYKAGVQDVTRMYSSSKDSRGKVNSNLQQITLSNKIRERSSEFAALETKRKIESLSKTEYKKFKDLKSYWERTILEESRIVCCTCSTAADGRLDGITFKNVFIDEAAQSIEPDTLIPLTFGAQKVLLAGDHKQLGPVIQCDLVKDAGLNRVLFERLMIHKAKHTMLDCQYRMHPLIAEFPSQTFYEGKLKTDDSVEQRHHREAISPFKYEPLRFIDIKGVEEKSGTSSMNMKEAKMVEKILGDLVSFGVKPDDIGIITPYVGQKAILQRKIHGKRSLKDVKIASVDEFQGGEKGYIIMSTVRTNSIGFLHDERRLNVAITRARFGMILVGNAELLRRDPHWRKLIEFYQGKSGFCGASAAITNGMKKPKKFSNPRKSQNGKKEKHDQKKTNSQIKNQKCQKKTKAQKKYVDQQQCDNSPDYCDD